ncbi:F510_1955 family glycosylhydrolase [Alkalihalobacillus sp. BA299]|uniref:F510_1955 family glycosylhydrolase n=1 Tax=Alkalihalobacillus sp. BA299 TaxID=2815938 RepID=UPI001ADA0886|nr:hypothetical protein [Alkalihalobacillus sp. BA299]
MKKYKNQLLYSFIISGAVLFSACGQSKAVPEEGELVETESELVEETEEIKEEKKSVDKDAVNEETNEVSHIHGLELNPSSPGRYLIATHHGLIEFVGLQEAYVLGAMRDDFMGFSRVANTNYLMSSGHPGFDSELPDPLGFMWSEDNGQSWELRSLLGEYDFHALAASYQDENHILGFALDYKNNYQSLIFRSKDQGFTWERIETNGLPLDHHGIYNLAFSPEDDNIVFAATAKGLLQSKDSGVNWTKILPGNITGFAVIGNKEVYYYDETNEQLYHWIGDKSVEVSYPREHGPINYLVVNEHGQLVVTTLNSSLLLKETDTSWNILIDHGKVQ